MLLLSSVSQKMRCLNLFSRLEFREGAHVTLNQLTIYALSVWQVYTAFVVGQQRNLAFFPVKGSDILRIDSKTIWSELAICYLHREGILMQDFTQVKIRFKDLRSQNAMHEVKFCSVRCKDIRTDDFQRKVKFSSMVFCFVSDVYMVMFLGL